MLGYAAGELAGRHYTDLMDADEGVRIRATHERRRTNKGEGWDGRLRHKDGHDVWVWVESSPFEVGDGTVGSLAMVTDVTEQKLARVAEEALREQMVVADRLSAIGQLAAGVGHEINNPLTFILADLDLLARLIPKAAPGVADMARMVAEIRDGAERIRHIVKGLTTFARAEGRPRAVLDLRAVVGSSIDVVENEIRHRARLVKDFGPTPSVEADEARLGQVFLSLLLNAAHAIPEGRADANEVRVTTGTDAAGRAFVEVRDTGRGIPAPLRARVFEPFGAKREVGSGSGIGLSLSRTIVTSLGGEISVESDPARGTAFRVVLPAARVQEPAVPTPPPSGVALTASERRGRVLIVDDDALVGRTLSLLVGDHDVTLAANGKEALDLIESSKPFDVIFCDLMMPVMTGMELHAALTTKQSSAARRMVFVTGGAFTPAAREFLAAVPNKVLEKPFDMDAIQGTVRAQLAHAS